MLFDIVSVDGSRTDKAKVLRELNSLAPGVFPPLTDNHLQNGHWWLVYPDEGEQPVGFAGMVPFEPFPGVFYLKRAYVAPDYRGHGLQLRLLFVREVTARELGCKCLVSECAGSNHHSASNFIKAGFGRCEPEQPWGAEDSIYFVKTLA
jgi:GNAT superfamily N-acetyltransferase